MSCLRFIMSAQRQWRIEGGFTPLPPEIPKFYQSWAEFPVPWNIHPKQPNQNMGFIHLQIEWNPLPGGYRPQIPIVSALDFFRAKFRFFHKRQYSERLWSKFAQRLSGFDNYWVSVLSPDRLYVSLVSVMTERSWLPKLTRDATETIEFFVSSELIKRYAS
jgi:hypothetical protein